MTLYPTLAPRTLDGNAEQELRLYDFKYAQPPALLPLYRRLRQHGLLYDERSRSWLCAHVPGLTSILSDGRFVSGRPAGSGTPPPTPGNVRGTHPAPGSTLRDRKASIERLLGRQLLVNDGTVHTRLQGIMNPVLRQMGHDMRASIEQQVEALLDAIESAGRWEVVQDLALPLVLGSMVQLLLGEKDLAPDSLQQFNAWSQALASVTSGFFSLESMQHVLAMQETFHMLLAHTREAPSSDLLSVLAADTRWQDDDELVANAMMLLAAGSVTTTKALTHSLWLLLQDAHAWEHLRTELLACTDARAQVQLLKPLVEWLLCRVTPTRYVVRWATRDSTIEGKRILAGQQVYLFLEGANDALVQQETPFDDAAPAAAQEQCPLLPGKLAPHVTFGSSRSPHYCPGAPLARLLLLHALQAVLLRFPSLQLAPVPVHPWGKHANLGALVALPVIHIPERGAYASSSTDQSIVS